MVMVDSQSRSNSNRAHTLDTGDEEEEEEEVGAPELVLACWGHHGAYFYPKANICTPKKSPSRSLASCLQWQRRPLLISQLLPSTSLHFLPPPL